MCFGVLSAWAISDIEIKVEMDVWPPLANAVTPQMLPSWQFSVVNVMILFSRAEFTRIE